ncbi:growth hormone receptor a [Lampris incognitus]|uniref:growth hormone receptor a n=1 Tax=Lampris incognitus TaxID=2546036 RepID=UPI0024B5B013|nr:growth hormone receptor a [Lampris incognitus]
MSQLFNRVRLSRSSDFSADRLHLNIMDFSSPPTLHLFLLITPLALLSAPGSAFLMDHMPSSAPSEPHFTECISREQETFRCWWSTGSFHNLSSPGALRVFYIKKDSSEWRECPEYIYSKQECFFNRSYTSIWMRYCIQLRTQNNVTYFNEDDCFTVENIVRPDPPVSLNWTLLKVSPSKLYYDIKVSWKPPPSADIERGWMRIEYEIQYRGLNSTYWEALEIQDSTQQTIYGLHIGEEYEVRIRCRMKAFTKFGEFSDSVFIEMTEIPSEESTFPVTLVLIIGVVGVIILIMLVILSQQHRLMVILLPPVPTPKIKGIDPELLKKGKLEELNFMLSGGGFGVLPSYAPDFYQDEPWVEFIEVEPEDADPAERENNRGSDTQKLLSSSQPTGHHTHLERTQAHSFSDEDSHRTGCSDRDLPNQEALTLMATLLPGQPDGDQGSLDDLDAVPEGGDRPQTWVNTDFYAQVSNVMPSGGVVLSPGQQLRTQESTSALEEKKPKKKGMENEREGESKKEEIQSDLQFQLLVVDPEGSGYTTESSARQIGTPSSPLMPGEGYQTVPPRSIESKPRQEAFLPTYSPAIAGDYQPPYIFPDSSRSQRLPPVSDYTVVQEVDCQRSLLLNPPSPQSPPHGLPQHPLKALPPMPVGYISPDLFGNLSP